MNLSEVGRTVAKAGLGIVLVTGSADCSPLNLGAQIENPTDGWQHFVSKNYPYEINLPPGWTAGQQQFGGKTQDIFKGAITDDFQTNVVVFSEPTEKNLEQYEADINDQLADIIMKARPNRGGPIGLSGYLLRAKIDGQVAWEDLVSLPKGVLLFNPELEQRIVFIVKNGIAWQIVLSSSPSAITTEEPKFDRMVSSFKFK